MFSVVGDFFGEFVLCLVAWWVGGAFHITYNYTHKIFLSIYAKLYNTYTHNFECVSLFWSKSSRHFKHCIVPVYFELALSEHETNFRYAIDFLDIQYML